MADEDLIKIGDQMVKVLEPVYEELDEIKNKLNHPERGLGSINDKLDAQTADIMELQKKANVTNDRFVGLEQTIDRLEVKIDQYMGANRKELSEIRKHTGLSILYEDSAI